MPNQCSYGGWTHKHGIQVSAVPENTKEEARDIINANGKTHWHGAIHKVIKNVTAALL